MGALTSAPVEEHLVDIADVGASGLNRLLHTAGPAVRVRAVNPAGAHNLAVGLDRRHEVTIVGHAGYYCAGMNDGGVVRVEGAVGVGVAENMMSGRVDVEGDASQSAAAIAHGGLLVIRGNASARCAISLKGADVVVAGDVGHMSAFMAQAGRLLVCGDAGDALGDSIYEARIYVRGRVASLGADCIEKPMRAEHRGEVAGLIAHAGVDADPAQFTRYGSARGLYRFHSDNVRSY